VRKGRGAAETNTDPWEKKGRANSTRTVRKKARTMGLVELLWY